MKRLHKILLMVLAVALLLGVIVVSAMATDTGEAKIGEVEYDTLVEAIAAVNASDSALGTDVTVTVLKDVTLVSDDAITITRAGVNLTLDLGGNTLSVSNVVNTKLDSNGDTVTLGVFNLTAEGTALTVSGGEIVAASANSGVFYIEDGVNAELTVTNVNVNFKGAHLISMLNARGGKAVVENSRLVAYGADTNVIRQANNAVVTISDSYLEASNGADMTSVIKTEATATAAAPEGSCHVYIENCELYGARNVLAGYIDGDGAQRAESVAYVNTSIMLKNSDIKQYNNVVGGEDTLVSGNYKDITLDGCNVEFAVLGMAANEGESVKLINSKLKMTLNGVAGKAPKSVIYGAGRFDIVGSRLYSQISDTTSYVFKDTVKDNVVVGEGTYINYITTENLNVKVTYAENCTAQNAMLNNGAVIVSATPQSSTIVQYTDFDFNKTFVHTPNTNDVVVAGGNAANPKVQNPMVGTMGNMWQARQGLISIEQDATGNAYFKYDPTYYVDEDPNDGGAAEANMTDISLSASGKYYYSQLKSAVQGYFHWGGALAKVGETGYYTVDFDVKSDGEEFFPIGFYVHVREGSNQGYGGTVALSKNGVFGSAGTVAKGEWAHITLVMQINAGTGGTYSSVTKYYLNGVYAGEVENHVKADVHTATSAISGIRSYSKPALSEGMSICFDNIVSNAYGTGYTDAAVLFTDENKPLTEWSGAYYNSSERVILENVPAAKIGNVAYDSFAAAYEAAVDGDTVTLFEDVEGLVSVKKAIIVDTNGYEFLHTSQVTDASPVAYKSVSANGRIFFSEALPSELVEVNFSESTGVYKILVAIGNYVEYAGTAVGGTTFDKVAGNINEFVGWGTAPDADVNDTVPPMPYIGSDDMKVTYYPIYHVIDAGAYAVVLADGKTFIPGGDTYAELMNAASGLADGATLVFLSDFENVDEQITINAERTFYIDLNGHDVKMPVKVTWLYASGNATVYVYSSRPGAEIFNKQAGHSYYSSRAINAGKATVYFGNFGDNAYGGNISVYSSVLVNAENASANVYIDEVSFYRTSSDNRGAILDRSGGKISVTDSLIVNAVAGDNNLLGVMKAASAITVDNCTIIGTLSSSGNAPVIANELDSGSITITNSDILNLTLKGGKTDSGTWGTITVGEGCTYNVSSDFNGTNGVAKLAEGLVAPEDKVWKESLDINLAYPVYYHTSDVTVPIDFTVYDHEKTFYKTYKVLSADDPAETVTVTWQNAAGDTIATETYLKGGEANYTGTAVAGEAFATFNTVVGSWEGNNKNLQADTVMRAVMVLNANVTGILNNVTIKESFDFNIYVPKHDSIVKIAISAAEDAPNLITTESYTYGGVEYFVIPYKQIAPNQIHRTITYYITVTDATYGTDTQTVTVSILDYAADLLASTEEQDIDKQLVMNMLVYANEAYKYFTGAENADVAAIVADEAYATYKTTAELTEAKDVSAVSAAIASARFELKSHVTLILKLAESYTGSVKVNSAECTAVDGIVRVELNVHDLADDITITVDGAEGEASATYNLATYAAAMAGNEAEALVKALYDFAVKASEHEAQ